MNINKGSICKNIKSNENLTKGIASTLTKETSKSVNVLLHDMDPTSACLPLESKDLV